MRKLLLLVACLATPVMAADAVDFTLPDLDGKPVSVADYRGKWVVLFFYARDFTYICPTEVAAFGDLQNDFAREDAIVMRLDLTIA